MSRHGLRRLGAWFISLTGSLAAILVPIAPPASLAQTGTSRNVLVMPQAQARAGAAPSQPLPPPVAPLAGNSIGIPVTVADESGNPVESLSEHDFSLRIGGDDRQVRFIRNGREQPAAIGIITDVSESMGNFPYSGFSIWVAEERSLARMLVAKLGGKNPAFLAGFARHFHLIEPYTTDRSLLERGIAEIRATAQYGDEGTALYDSIMKGIMVLAHGPSPRRILIALTDGKDNISWHHVEDAVVAAQRSNVAVYLLVIERAAFHSGPFGWQDSGDRMYRDTLFRISTETGGRGFVVYDPRTISRAALAIAAEVNGQYLVEFASLSLDDDGEPVELFVKNHPGLQVRAPRVVRLRHEESDQLAMP